MYDIPFFFARKDEKYYRVVQDDDGRIAYVPADKSEMRVSDLLTVIPEHAFMVGITAPAKAP